MTTSQEQLYEYLQHNYSNRFISSKQIIKDIPAYAEAKSAMGKVRHDAMELQREYAFGELNQCVIGLNSTGYKIGNQEEISRYISRRWKKDVKSMKLSRAIAEKAGLDGQMNMYGEEEITTKREEKDNE